MSGPSPGDLPNPGFKPRSPALQVDYLPAEPQGKPKDTRVGSLPLLHGKKERRKRSIGLFIWYVCVAMGRFTSVLHFHF